jgi:hypothetical protein
MTEITKFPDMRPKTPPGPIRLPSPAGYVQRVPLFPTTDGSAGNRRFERKRLLLWFGVAVAFHAALLLGLWLMPALRIKWEPSPDAWVQITSVPRPLPVPERAEKATAPKQAAPAQPHTSRPEAQPRPAVEPRPESDRSAHP